MPDDKTDPLPFSPGAAPQGGPGPMRQEDYKPEGDATRPIGHLIPADVAGGLPGTASHESSPIPGAKPAEAAPAWVKPA
jgi:hypothetical protein